MSLVQAKFSDTKPPGTAPKTQDPLDSEQSDALHDPLAGDLTPTVTEGSPDGPGDDKPTAVADVLADLMVVIDPVAQMTSGASGSYNRGLAGDKQKGFYGMAIAECARLIAALQPALNGDEHEAARAAIAILDGYASLYAALSAAGTSQEDADAVAAVHKAMEPAIYGLDPQLLGPAVYDKALLSFNELGVFVDSWADIKSTYGGQGQLSASMWRAFLQTVERERQILNQYELLDERGGSDKYTSRRRIAKDDGSGMVFDAEEAAAVGQADGGFMVSALESYGMHARNMEQYKIQIAEIQERILDGEFESQADAVAAFKQAVGGGETSQAFQEQLEALANGTWSIALAEGAVRDEVKVLDRATAYQKKAEQSMNQHDAHSKHAQSAYGAHLQAGEEKDKPAADEAWNKVLAYKNLAEGKLAKAEQLIHKDVPELMETAADLHADATTYLHNARAYVSAVDVDRYEVLDGGVRVVETRADKVASDLEANAKAKLKIEATNTELAANAQDRRDRANSWKPEQVDIPAPSEDAAKDAGGVNVKTEAYSSVSVGLEGTVPGAPFMKLFGGYTGKNSKVNDNGERWTKTNQSIECGVKIDLWIVNFAIKYVGTLEGGLKGGNRFPEFGETLSRVNTELNNLESAHELDSGGYLPRLVKALDFYPSAVQQQVWDPLHATAAAVAGGGKSERKAFDAQVEQSAALMRSLWGSDTDVRGFHKELVLTFGNLAGFWEALITALKLNDGDDMAEEILALLDVDDNEVVDDVNAQYAGWKSNADEIVDNTNEKLSAIEFLNNDPDVTVSTSNKIEVSAEAGISGSVSGKVSYAHTWKKKDGEGKYMDTTTHESDLWKLSIKGGKVEGDISYTKEKDKDTLQLDASFPGQKPKAKAEEDKAITDMSTLWQSMKGGQVGAEAYELMLKQSANWAKQFGKSWTQQYDPSKVLPVKNSDSVSIGVKLVWKKGKFDKCTLSLGYEAKTKAEANMGVVKGSVEFKAGTKISWEI